MTKLTKSSKTQIEQIDTIEEKTTSKDYFIVLGDSGTNISQGIIDEEYNADLKGPVGMAMFNKMYMSDAQVFLSITACELPIASTRWYIEAPTDKDGNIIKGTEEITEYLNMALFEKMDKSWDELLDEILSFFVYGFSLFEKVYSYDGDKVWLKDLGYRKQTTVEKWQTEDGQPGITQILPTVIDKKSTISIPASKLVLFSLRKKGRNYEGISLLRPAFKHWYMKEVNYKLDAVRNERQAIGIPVIYIPKTATEKDKTKMIKIAKNIRGTNMSGIVMPGSKDDGWLFEYADTKANTSTDYFKSIEHHDQKISDSVLALFLKLGNTQSGSYAMAESHTDLFMHSLTSYAKLITSVFNRYIIPELVDLNFQNVEKYPQLKFDKIGEIDYNTITSAISSLTGSGIITPDQELENHLRKILNLPPKKELTPEEISILEQEQNNSNNQTLPQDELNQLDELDTQLSDLSFLEFREPVTDETKQKISEALIRFWSTRKKQKEEKIGEKSKNISDLKTQIDSIKNIISSLGRKKITSDQRKELTTQIASIREQIKSRKEEIKSMLKQDKDEQDSINKADKQVIDDNKKVYDQKISGYRDEIDNIRKNKSNQIKDLKKDKIKNIKELQKKRTSLSKTGLTDEEKNKIDEERNQISNQIDNIRDEYDNKISDIKDNSDNEIEEIKNKIDNEKDKYQSDKNFLKDKKETMKDNRIKKDIEANEFLETMSLVDNSIVSELYRKCNSKEDIQELKKKGIIFNEYEEESPRPLTFAERKVRFKTIKEAMATYQNILNEKLSEISEKQKADLLQQIKKAVDGNDIGKLGEIKAKYKNELNQVLTDIQKELFEIGKKTASVEMGVSAPVTNNEVKGVMRAQNLAIINKLTSDIENQSITTVTQIANAKGGSITKTESTEAINAVKDILDKTISKATATLNTFGITGAINWGRTSVFEQHPDKVYAMQYSAILDDKTTDICLSLDGRVVKAGSADYYTYSPPRHYNCRSIWVELLEEEFKPKLLPKESEEQGKDVFFKPTRPEIKAIPKAIPATVSIDQQAEMKAPVLLKGSPAIDLIKQEIDDRKEKLAQYIKDDVYPNRQKEHEDRIKQLEKAIKNKFTEQLIEYYEQYGIKFKK